MDLKIHFIFTLKQAIQSIRKQSSSWFTKFVMQRRARRPSFCCYLLNPSKICSLTLDSHIETKWRQVLKAPKPWLKHANGTTSEEIRAPCLFSAFQSTVLYDILNVPVSAKVLEHSPFKT